MCSTVIQTLIKDEIRKTFIGKAWSHDAHSWGSVNTAKLEMEYIRCLVYGRGHIPDTQQKAMLIYYCGDGVSCNQGWPPALYIAEVGYDPSAPTSQVDYRYVPPCQHTKVSFWCEQVLTIDTVQILWGYLDIIYLIDIQRFHFYNVIPFKAIHSVFKASHYYRCYKPLGKKNKEIRPLTENACFKAQGCSSVGRVLV